MGTQEIIDEIKHRLDPQVIQRYLLPSENTIREYVYGTAGFRDR